MQFEGSGRLQGVAKFLWYVCRMWTCAVGRSWTLCMSFVSLCHSCVVNARDEYAAANIPRVEGYVSVPLASRCAEPFLKFHPSQLANGNIRIYPRENFVFCTVVQRYPRSIASNRFPNKPRTRHIRSPPTPALSHTPNPTSNLQVHSTTKLQIKPQDHKPQPQTPQLPTNQPTNPAPLKMAADLPPSTITPMKYAHTLSGPPLSPPTLPSDLQKPTPPPPNPPTHHQHRRLLLTLFALALIALTIALCVLFNSPSCATHTAVCQDLLPWAHGDTKRSLVAVRNIGFTAMQERWSAGIVGLGKRATPSARYDDDLVLGICAGGAGVAVVFGLVVSWVVERVRRGTSIKHKTISEGEAGKGA
ncbi:uncharacterized protein M421DRAFT_176174 [Didymella exigua CBS 183.55]|uniref:Uncharacterized protein n=1 Tax=Didymella exigua CBS 183.55 TaxID=1150837 RepID=A0A6A5RIK9_9PLEO|nr:uncharacterized protein M421DRAFT_176174 [Didymella exigua CBS 183.55]KAF1927293.1 hypothetical protein M421DRAFT_176174 [Didymella exigua CBS 183.55]